MHIRKRAYTKIAVEGSNPNKISISDKKYELGWGLEEDTMKGLVEVFSWYMRGYP